MKPFFNNFNGQTLVELLITIGLAAILIPALLGGFLISRSGRVQQEQRLRAISYLKETQEALRIVQSNGWTNFPNGIYHPVMSSTTWALVAGPEPETVDGFVKQVEISPVLRDANGDIATIGGVLDPSTKKFEISVSWTSPLSASVSGVSYLTRHKNISKIETTVADFTGGILVNTAISSTQNTGIPNDGQIQLGSGGGANGGDWCKPDQYVLQTFDLPGQGVAQSLSATSTATQNIAYTTTGGNASGDAVDGLTISFDAPIPTVANPHFNNEAKAYGIFVEKGGSYVYFNENNPPNHTVRIANAGDLSVVGYFDSSNKTGNSVYVSGNTGYTISGSTLYSFDVSSKVGSRAQRGTVNLAANGKRVFVVGTNAYVATTSTTSQLQIIDVSNPSNMTVSKNINLGNNLAGVDVYINSSQTFAYIVTSYAVGKNDFFIVDLTNTNNIYGYSTNGMTPKGITVVPRNRAIVVGSGGTLYQVFDTTIPSAASYCGGMSPASVTSINAVDSVSQPDGRVFSYILTDNPSAEFQIVLGGPGSGQFATSGTYTSSPVQLPSASTFNHFSATVTEPLQTQIAIQVAVAQAVNNSCSGALYSYVGPDGSTGSYFNPVGSTISAQIPFSGSDNFINPGECFSYKVTFSSSDLTLTPILNDITVNYSP